MLASTRTGGEGSGGDTAGTTRGTDEIIYLSTRAMRNKQNETGTYLVGDFYYVTPLWQHVNKVHISNITELTGVHLIKNLKNEVFQIPEAVLQGFFRPHCLAS